MHALYFLPLASFIKQHTCSSHSLLSSAFQQDEEEEEEGRLEADTGDPRCEALLIKGLLF